MALDNPLQKTDTGCTLPIAAAGTQYAGLQLCARMLVVKFLKSNWLIIVGLVGFAIAAGLTVVVSFLRDLTDLESSLFQIIILVISLLLSYLFVQKSANDAAQERVSLHARSAFRRVVRLYVSLSRLATIIDQRRQTDASTDRQDLDLIHAVIEQHIPTIGDALEDWRDLVPENVEEIEREFEQRQRDLEDLRR